MISSDGGDVKRQRTEEKEGRRSATLIRQEDGREKAEEVEKLN